MCINNVVQTSALHVMKTDLIRAHVHIIIHVDISDLCLGSLTDTIISLLHSFLGHLFSKCAILIPLGCTVRY
jgi:hypothetical protein